MVDIKTAAGIIGLSEQTLKKQCRAGKFVFKIVKRGKYANYFVLLKSLPIFAQDKYFGETLSDIKYSELQIGQNNRLKSICKYWKTLTGLKGDDI